MQVLAAPGRCLAHLITVVFPVLPLSRFINMQIFSLIDQSFLTDSSMADEMKTCDVTQWSWWSCDASIAIQARTRCQMRNVEEFKFIFMEGFRIKILEHLDCLETNQTPNFTLHMKSRKGKWIQVSGTPWTDINIVFFQNYWIEFSLCNSRIIRSVSQLATGREYLESTSWRSCKKGKGYCC